MNESSSFPRTGAASSIVTGSRFAGTTFGSSNGRIHPFSLDGARSRPRRARRSGRSPTGRRRDPASLLAAEARLPRRRQLPGLHGRDRGRAGARRFLRPQAGGGHEGTDRERARPLARARWCSSCWSATSRRRGRARSRLAVLAMGRQLGVEDSRFPRAARRRRPTAAIRRWPCSSTPASSATSASAPAAKSRSTTSSAWRPRPSRKDRLRFRRPDGQQHLRRLRRMRPGLPDRRIDAGDPGRRQRRQRQRARPRGRQRSAPIAGSAAS